MADSLRLFTSPQISVHDAHSQVHFALYFSDDGFGTQSFLSDCRMQTLERRLPPKKNSGPFINISHLKNPAFAVYYVARFTAFFGRIHYFVVRRPVKGLMLTCSTSADTHRHRLEIRRHCAHFLQVEWSAMVDWNVL